MSESTPKPPPQLPDAIAHAITAKREIERRITDMLAEWQRETGLHVDSIKVNQLEVTRVEDSYRRFEPLVEIRVRVL